MQVEILPGKHSTHPDPELAQAITKALEMAGYTEGTWKILLGPRIRGGKWSKGVQYIRVDGKSVFFKAQMGDNGTRNSYRLFAPNGIDPNVLFQQLTQGVPPPAQTDPASEHTPPTSRRHNHAPGQSDGFSVRNFLLDKDNLILALLAFHMTGCSELSPQEWQDILRSEFGFPNCSAKSLGKITGALLKREWLQKLPEGSPSGYAAKYKITKKGVEAVTQVAEKPPVGITDLVETVTSDGSLSSQIFELEQALRTYHEAKQQIADITSQIADITSQVEKLTLKLAELAIHQESLEETITNPDLVKKAQKLARIQEILSS